MASAALTLIFGFFMGRALPPDSAQLTTNLMDQINILARENKKLEDIKKSPLVWSNVIIKELDNNSLSLSFDVTTHLEMVGKKNSPLVREVIAQTLLNPSNAGSELKAISYTTGVIDSKLKEALIFSMLNTPLLAVRLKAMNSLLGYPNDQEVTNSFFQVLKEEESVKMRLLAIDYLTQKKVPVDTLQKVLSESKVIQSPAVRIKMKTYEESFENK
jgi:hypothetical protein